MADKKISALTSAATPVIGTEVLPIVQSGETVKVSINDLTAGKSVPASSFVANSRTTYGVAAVYDAASPTGNAVGIAFGGSSSILPCNGTGAVTNNTASLGSSSYTWKNLYMGDNIIQGTAAKGINFTANTAAAGKTSQLLNWYEEGTWTPNQGSGLTVVGAFSSSGTYTRIGRQVMIRGQVSGATSIAVVASGVISSNLPYTASTTHAGSMFNGAVNVSGSVQITSASVVAASAITATPSITFTAVYAV